MPSAERSSCISCYAVKALVAGQRLRPSGRPGARVGLIQPCAARFAGGAGRRATVASMPAYGKIWVMDRFAYDERQAIIEADGVWCLEASRETGEAAYSTRMSRVCTDAANGDWEPAQAWCTEIGKRFGASTAAGVMQDIWDNLDGELKWRNIAAAVSITSKPAAPATSANGPKNRAPASRMPSPRRCT